MTDALAILDRAANALAAHPDEDVQLVADWLRAGAPGDLIEHLGAESTRGHSIRLQLAYKRRNVALCAAAAPWRDLPPPEAARLLANAFRRYFTDAWPRERHLAGNPHPVGSRPGYFWAALRTIDRPIGQRQAERILRRAPAYRAVTSNGI